MAVEILTEKLNRVIAGEETMYKLIFLDYNMTEGRMNGPETAKQLRQIMKMYEGNYQTVNFARPFICCLTAQSGKKFRDAAISQGMDNYYLKPIDFHELD